MKDLTRAHEENVASTKPVETRIVVTISLVTATTVIVLTIYIVVTMETVTTRILVC